MFWTNFFNLFKQALLMNEIKKVIYLTLIYILIAISAFYFIHIKFVCYSLFFGSPLILYYLLRKNRFITTYPIRIVLYLVNILYFLIWVFFLFLFLFWEPPFDK